MAKHRQKPITRHSEELLPPAVIVGRACVVPASSPGPRVVLVKALLSLVNCLLFAIIVSSVLIIGVVAAVGYVPLSRTWRQPAHTYTFFPSSTHLRARN